MVDTVTIQDQLKTLSAELETYDPWSDGEGLKNVLTGVVEILQAFDLKVRKSDPYQEPLLWKECNSPVEVSEGEGLCTKCWMMVIAGSSGMFVLAGGVDECHTK